MTEVSVTLNPFVQPLQLSDCILWLDAADRNTVFEDISERIYAVPGSLLAVWKDKSPRNCSAVSSSTEKPTLQENSILFSGAQSLQLDSTLLPLGLCPFTLFVVGTSTDSGVNTLFSYGKKPTTFNQVIQVFSDSGKLNANLYLSSSIADGTNQLNQRTLTSLIYSSYLNGWMNGSLFSSKTNVRQILNTVPGFATIGSGYADSNPAYFLNGSIHEIIMYSRELSTDERQQIEGYLAWKWDTDLDPSHPYINTNFVVPGPFPQVPLVQPVTEQFYSPRRLPYLCLWLDASDAGSLTALDNSTHISIWKDKSGKGFNATQSLLSQSPIYANKSIQFINQSYLSLPNTTIPPGNSAYSIYVVFTPTCNTEIPQNIFSSGTDHVDQENTLYYTSTAFTHSWNSNTISGGTPVIGKQTLLESFYIMNTVRSLYENGNLLITSPADERKSDVMNNYIGFSGESQINEIIMYSVAHTEDERKHIEGYLTWKWSLNTLLPASHPYILFPPSP
jgi:hypothetical protein